MENETNETAAEPGSAILARLFDEGAIRVRRGALFDEVPTPRSSEGLGDRVEGMLLGLAIGDALGNTTEGLTPQMRAMTHGEVRDYLPNPLARGRAVGLPTDDTQLAFWTLEQLLLDGRLVPDRVAARFCREPIRGVGMTVSEFVHEYRDRKRPWQEAGRSSAGNGALMRIAPVLVPHLAEPSSELWADTALAAMITHNDPASIAACLAFVKVLWELLDGGEAPEPRGWIDGFCDAMSDLEGDTAYQPRSLRYRYEGPIWEFARDRVGEALEHGLSVSDATEEWLSGAYLLETVPSVLYVLARWGHDAERAIIRAVNDTTDNDTIGAIVGAAVGALHGRQALPERWIEGLLGRTGAEDDGRVFELIAQARERWVPGA